MVMLILPVLISLFISSFYCVKFINTHKLAIIFPLATVINVVCLFLGIVYSVITSQDGLAVVGQMGIYAVCFGVILLINVITVIIAKNHRAY
jgi:hypothetical protein